MMNSRITWEAESYGRVRETFRRQAILQSWCSASARISRPAALEVEQPPGEVARFRRRCEADETSRFGRRRRVANHADQSLHRAAAVRGRPYSYRPGLVRTRQSVPMDRSAPASLAG